MLCINWSKGSGGEKLHFTAQYQQRKLMLSGVGEVRLAI